MLSTNRLKKIKSNFPVLVGDNVVSKSVCNLLIKEISNSKSFDDMIMIEKELEAKRQEAEALKDQSLQEVKKFIEFVESML